MPSERRLAGSDAIDGGLGLLQAHASQFPVALDGTDLVADRDQCDDIGWHVIAGHHGEPGGGAHGPGADGGVVTCTLRPTGQRQRTVGLPADFQGESRLTMKAGLPGSVQYLFAIDGHKRNVIAIGKFTGL
jgi:hypothetical protein